MIDPQIVSSLTRYAHCKPPAFTNAKCARKARRSRRAVERRHQPPLHHQRLSERGHHRPEQIRTGLRELLLQPARHIDTGSCGHRVAPSHRDLWSELNEDHAVAVSPHDARSPAQTGHHLRGRNPYGDSICACVSALARRQGPQASDILQTAAESTDVYIRDNAISELAAVVDDRAWESVMTRLTGIL